MSPTKPCYYWDACMFYEVLGDEPVSATKKAAVQEILTDNKDRKSLIITSVVTHIEVLPKKLQAKDIEAEQKYLALFDGERFLDLEIGRNVLIRAREIRDYYFKPPDPVTKMGAKMMDAVDAVHLATATINGVTEFHTRDDDQKGTKIPLVSLYSWSGEPRLCGKYDLKIVSPEAAQGGLEFGEK